LQYQKSKTPSVGGERGNLSRGQFDQGDDHSPGQDDGFRDRFSGQERPVSGEVIAKDNDSITVKVQDGWSKIIFISDTTTVAKTEEGSLDDLAEGTQVVVFGSQNDDGSIAAESIQPNPSLGLDHPPDDEQGGRETSSP